MPGNVRSDRDTHQHSNRKMRLFSGPLSMFGAKVQIAAHEKNIDFELVMVPFTQKEGYAPKHPEVLRVSPKRQVPVLIDGSAGATTGLVPSRSSIPPRSSSISKTSSRILRCGPRGLPRGPGLAGWSMNRTRCISRISSS